MKDCMSDFVKDAERVALREIAHLLPAKWSQIVDGGGRTAGSREDRPLSPVELMSTHGSPRPRSCTAGPGVSRSTTPAA
jgi:hypothetical protein